MAITPIDVQALLNQAEVIIAQATSKPADPNGPIGKSVEEWFEYKTQQELLKAKASEIQKIMDGISESVVERMTTQELDSVKTKYGTFSLKPKSMPSVEDFGIFLRWVAEDIDNRMGFLSKSVNSSPINEMLQNEGLLPPGVKTYIKDQLSTRSAKK